KTITKKQLITSKLFFVPSSPDGLIGALQNALGGDVMFSDLKRPFSALAVDIKTGKEVDLAVGSVAKAVAASCSIPGVFKPTVWGDMLLMDGSLQNTIPASVCREHGCKYVIGIDVSGGREITLKSASVVDVLKTSISILINSSATKGIIGSDIVIKPDTKRFGFTKVEGVDEMIEEGYRAALDAMDDIKKLFEPELSPKEKIILEKRKRKLFNEQINH
ncbi:MAG: patatin-like phospholipase family protein, partial [Firmicutes bacterium]|nr:patatin-like phospholipase family protein [Bacillota bacterium]